jgi:VWFA-related protein
LVKRTLLVLCVAFAVGAVTSFTTEEQPAEDVEPIGGLAFVDQLEITVVNVVAYVTDKKGNAITDLTRDDFRVFQDGQQREISNFQLYTEDVYRDFYQEPIPGAPPEPPTRSAGDDSTPPLDLRPSYMAIYVDHQNLRPLDRNRVLNQLRSFVRDNCRPPVQMMVASYNRSLKVDQPFTSDADAVLAALRGMRKTTGGRTNVDRQRQEIYESIQRERQDNSVARGQERGDRVYGLAHGFVEEEVNNLQFTLQALREALTMLGGLPGKKSVLYISNGLPMVPGIDIFYAMSNAFQQPELITRSSRYAQYRSFERLVSNANAQDVTFYTIAAGGLEVIGAGGAETQGPQDTMAASMGYDNYLESIMYMADTTGGVAIFNTNNIETHLGRVEQDFYTYYSLGYRLQASGADKVHRVKVELPNHPGLRLRYRQRFVEKSLESKVQDRVTTGLVFPIDENPMQVVCAIDTPAPASEDRWSVPFELSFPIEYVALMPIGEDYVGQVVLFIAARDTKGKQSDLVRQQHEVRIPADQYERARLDRFTISASLLMEAGAYKVSVGLLDQLTRQASYATVSARVGG